MHIFGVTRVWALRNLKCSSIGMAGEAEFALDANAFHSALHAVELDAVVERVRFHAVEHAVEIEVPPRAAEFAVGRDFEPDLLLLLDDLLDLAVFNLGKLRRADLALFALGAGFLERHGAQNAADNVGTERWLGSRHRGDPP